MAQYFNPFRAGAAGGAPAGFTASWASGSAAAWLRHDDAGAGYCDRKGLRYIGNGSIHLLYWDDAGVANDWQVRTRFRTSTLGTAGNRLRAGLCARTAISSAASASGYSLRVYGESVWYLQLDKGSGTNIGQTDALVPVPDTWYAMVLECTGTTIRGKIWADPNGDPDDEPAWGAPGSVELTATDNSYANGGVGLCAGTNEGETLFDAIAAGSAGSAAVLFGPPTDPGAFTEPLADAVVETLLSAAWGAAYDCAAITYELQLSLDGGGTWPHVLATGLTDPEWAGAICEYGASEEARLRVRASTDNGDSAWVESGNFEINPILLPGRMKNMRACQRQLLASAQYGVHARFLATDGAGTDIDYTEFFISARWAESIDQPVISATVDLAYVADGDSLSPLVEGSARNTDGAAGYAPALYPGRWCALYVAITRPGVEPEESDYVVMWEGRIDAVEFASEEGITLRIRDLGGWLVETQIEDEITYAVVANPLATLMQSILDDNPHHPSDPVFVLVVQGDPDWQIDRHVQAQTKLMQALLDLAQQNGWDVRCEWTEGGFALRLAEPRRDIVDPDTTWGPDDEYLEVPLAEIGDDLVRNRLRALYKDAGGVLRQATLNNSSSAEIFGNRFMQLGGQPIAAITTAPEADRLLVAVGADVAFPEFDHAYRFRFNPFFMLGDFFAFTQNGVHYDQDQTGAVVHIEHVLEGGGGTSTIRTTGKPRAAYRAWLLKEDPRYPPEVLTLGLTDLGGGEMEITATFSQSVKRVEVWERIDTPPTPEDQYSVGRYKPEDFPITLSVANGEHNVLIHAFDDHGQVGDAEDSITTAGGGGGDDPGDTPTDVPGTPYLTRGAEAGGFQNAQAEWVNTNVIHDLDYQWTEDGVEGAWNTGLPAGTDDYSDLFAVGSAVKLRLRYTAGVGQEGPPSPWSNYLALTG